MSELFLTRKEIRRRAMARLGYTTSDDQAPLIQEQLNENIRAAAEQVYERCAWAQTLRETRVDIGIDQRFINYPASTGPGQIVGIAVWDADAQCFRPLQRTRIPAQADDEPVVEVGEPDSISGRGRPTHYECKAQIELWRRADQAYRLKLDHSVTPNFESDTQLSVVDGEAIILLTIAEHFAFQGDRELAARAERRAQERIDQLIADQHPGTTLRRGRRRADPNAEAPWVMNSGQWPSVLPEP